MTRLSSRRPMRLSLLVSAALALVVPADAIQRIETQTFVWLADSNNQATRREVRIGYIANGQAEVVSGLTAGETVIVAGIAELTEGIRIVIGR